MHHLFACTTLYLIHTTIRNIPGHFHMQGKTNCSANSSRGQQMLIGCASGDHEVYERFVELKAK
jgi:hypothetical protein